ncbi:MAG: hypothetical protein U0X91_15380 [Spirosomataceae bacterium]
MTASPQTEFYADRTVDQIENCIKVVYKVIWWIWPTVFWIYFLGLWFLPANIQKVAGDIGSRLLTKIPVSGTILYSIAFLPFWLWIVGLLLSRAVKIVRKYFLYPKTDFTETAIVPIERRERVVHRSDSDGLYSYLLWVKHPVSQALIKVDVEDADTFEKIKEQEQVQIKHLLTPTNIIYLTVR